MPRYDAFMKIETVDGEPKADDRFAIDWANEVALGGPDTAPDNGGFVVESDAPVSASGSDDGVGELHMVLLRRQHPSGWHCGCDRHERFLLGLGRCERLACDSPARWYALPARHRLAVVVL